MKIKDEILKFMSTRPETLGIIGYGSGVNPQKSQEKRNPQIDLIVIVDNLRAWHLSNMKTNKEDYSFTAKLFFKYAPYKWLKSGARICYMTYIPFEGKKYKIGTIENQDFLNDLETWETFYMAGRMQKPILIVKSTNDIVQAINKNRINALITTQIILNTERINVRDFYIKLTSLSYIGDTRMGIAENPDKIENIVDGSFEFYENNYNQNLTITEGQVVINKDYNIEELPKNLYERLKNSLEENKSKDTIEFLTQKNRSQSLSQTIKGIFTTGLVKATKYALEKLKRKQKK